MIQRILGFIVAIVLFSSGVIHAVQPYFFVSSVAAYKIVPLPLIGLVLLIPYLQIVLALCYLLDVAKKTSATLGAILFLVFSIAQIVVLVRGDSISCGCFGVSSLNVGIGSLSIPLICLVSCVVLLRMSDGSPQSAKLPE